MGLSYDIISEFVKITNDNKEKPKEGTVYATVVSSSGGKYVKIDGSDLLTPMDTTADIEDGERVTLTIKDHKAIVTGNVTSPSASTSKVDKVSETVSSLSDRVGTFELVVADKISTKELEAYKATVEVLIAQKASIENLNATNAEIDKLKAKDAQIENLVADKATISDLQAVNATIENLKAKDVEIENAVIDNLEATTADIRILSSDFAQIKTLVNGNLTSDNILSFNITSEKVTMEDAFIKDAMIDTISAGKINAGKINTNVVSIGSEDGAMTINGSTQQFRDKDGNVRIQIGQDASGDFTFILYGEDGTGQLINQNGITASAIGSGLIVNDMVSDNAAIAGGKLDISSVITEINNDNSTTIKSNKIYLNEQEQSLEVAFNSLKTKVDTIQEVTIDGDLAAVTEQVQSNTTQIAINKESINSLVSEDTVLKKQVSDLNDNIISTEETLTAKYTTLEQNLEGFQTNVADTYATKASVNDVNNNLSKNYSTTTTMNSAIAQKASEITASVASTYATKNEVKTLNDNLEANYSTTEQMESAIAVAKDEIDLSVSSIYETKTESTTKANKAKADAISAASTDASTKANKAKADAISTASTDASTKANKAKADAISAASTDATSKVNAAKTELNTAINNIQVGGTNLWVLCDIITGYENLGGIITTDVGAQHKTRQTLIPTNGAKELVYQCWNQNGITNEGNTNRVAFFDSSKTHISSSILNKLNGQAYQHQLIDIPENAIYMRLGAICGPNNNTYDDTIKIKFELGNKPTDYSLAPEDVQSSIDAKANSSDVYNKTETYTKSETDSKINIAKDAINLGVSQTYETKTNVESMVTSTLGSAKSYADTKKTEAITAASTDATSKVNAAKTELNTAIAKKANSSDVYNKTETYTKSETDSKINIAKDAINLGVSQTYETKENTTSKITNAINNIQVGGTNLWVLLDLKTGHENSGNINGSTAPHKTRQTLIPTNGAKELVYQCWNPNKVANSSNTNRVAFFDSSKTYISSTQVLVLNGQTYQHQIINIPENTAYMRLGAICGSDDNYDTTIKIKFEFGNKPTDYSLAPEDVQNKINSISIGGVNRLSRTDIPQTKNINNPSNYDIWDPYFTPNKQTLKELGFKIGDQITLGFNWNISKNGSNNFVYGDCRAEMVRYTDSGNLEYIGVIKNPIITFSSSNTSGRSEATVTLTHENLLNMVALRLRIDNSVLTLTISDVKLEKGNKATSWSPAPEDVKSDITSLESETNSIKQTVTSLQLGTDNINATVKSLSETLTTSNQNLAADIASVQNQVNMAMTSDEVKMEIKKELVNGVNKVTTSTGYVFDQNGLSISKSGSEMETKITEDGMKVFKNDEVMLTANNQGVDAKNLHATTYLIIGGNSRMEDFKHGTEKRTAVFWIG